YLNCGCAKTRVTTPASGHFLPWCCAGADGSFTPNSFRVRARSRVEHICFCWTRVVGGKAPPAGGRERFHFPEGILSGAMRRPCCTFKAAELGQIWTVTRPAGVAG